MLKLEGRGAGHSHCQHTGAVVMRCESQLLGAGYSSQFFANDGRPSRKDLTVRETVAAQRLSEDPIDHAGYGLRAPRAALDRVGFLGHGWHTRQHTANTLTVLCLGSHVETIESK